MTRSGRWISSSRWNVSNSKAVQPILDRQAPGRLTQLTGQCPDRTTAVIASQKSQIARDPGKSRRTRSKKKSKTTRTSAPSQGRNGCPRKTDASPPSPKHPHHPPREKQNRREKTSQRSKSAQTTSSQSRNAETS